MLHPHSPSTVDYGKGLSEEINWVELIERCLNP